MGRLHSCFLGGFVRALLAAIAILTFAPSSAQPLWSCDSDSDCTGPYERCVLDRCINVQCNSDLECTNRLPLCEGGQCQDPLCSVDSDCPGASGCAHGHCERIQCTLECFNDRGCPEGGSCVDHRCRDCVTSDACGPHGVCRNNNCVGVECTRPAQCAFDQTCDENHCVPFCEDGRTLVSASDGNRICKVCVNPNTAQRCNEFPGCGIGNNTICAQGFCINRCGLDPPDFDGLLDDFTRHFATFPIPMALLTVHAAPRSSSSPTYARCSSGVGSTNP